MRGPVPSGSSAGTRRRAGHVVVQAAKARGMSTRIGRAAAAAILAPALVAVVAILSLGQAATNPLAAPAACPAGAGITLPPGFCATIFADNLGRARHLAVAPNGTVYVNTLGGPSSAGGFLVALRDTKGQGRADVVRRFGTSAAGGTGIAYYKGAIYAEMSDRILRYPLPAGAILPNGPPQVVVSGLPLGGDHPMHPFAISAQGTLFVDVASATNSCQLQNRVANSPGDKPCDELLTRAGIWRYDANKTGQRFSTAERFAKGLRNGEGLSFDLAGRLYATEHGRDQLYENWPSLYKPAQGQNLPGEEIVILRLGADYGWPACYFDLIQMPSLCATTNVVPEPQKKSATRSFALENCPIILSNNCSCFSVS